MKMPCLLLATVFVATAAVAEPAPEGDVSCTIFPPAQIVRGEAFDVRVSRVPGYPGSWFSPTVTVRAIFPTEAGWGYELRASQTIPKMGAIRTDFTLMAPYSIYPDPQGGIVPGGTVKLVALVSEPTTGAPLRSVCTATTVVAW